MADNLQIYKYCIHMVAQSYGKTATFMPKPIFGDNGSGMHVHQSIWKGGKPVMAGDKYADLSDECLWYIGGIIKHAKALNGFTNPSTNSYKRLVPGFEAPVLLAYSVRNRSAACRIPWTSNPKAKRVEVRFPDPVANPYLAFSAMLMAGLDGIINKIDPGPAMDKDLYDLPPKELKKIPTVCGSLREALSNLDKDRAFLKAGGVFDDDFIDSYIELKMGEVQRFEMAPHPVEFDMYYSVLRRLRASDGKRAAVDGRPFSFVRRRRVLDSARVWLHPGSVALSRAPSRKEETPMTNPKARAPLRRASALRRRSAGALVGALAACGAVASAWAADVDHGEKLARRWCAACHIVAPDQTHGQDNVPPFATIAKIPGFDADKIALFLLRSASQNAGHAAVAPARRRIWRPISCASAGEGESRRPLDACGERVRRVSALLSPLRRSGDDSVGGRVYRPALEFARLARAAPKPRSPCRCIEPTRRPPSAGAAVRAALERSAICRRDRRADSAMSPRRPRVAALRSASGIPPRGKPRARRRQKTAGAHPFPQGEFDRDLPNADGGDEYFVRLLANQRDSPGAQPLGVGQRPDRDLRIQQKLQASPRKRRAITSLAASNSACEEDGYRPSSNPNRLPVRAGAPIGASRAAGLPFRAMMISLVAPLSTSSTTARDAFWLRAC